VILNTVLGDSQEREAALAAGANDYVCKNNAIRRAGSSTSSTA
jgi:DNA-binding response OmpR family regulator